MSFNKLNKTNKNERKSKNHSAYIETSKIDKIKTNLKSLHTTFENGLALISETMFLLDNLISNNLLTGNSNDSEIDESPDLKRTATENIEDQRVSSVHNRSSIKSTLFDRTFVVTENQESNDNIPTKNQKFISKIPKKVLLQKKQVLTKSNKTSVSPQGKSKFNPIHRTSGARNKRKDNSITPRKSNFSNDDDIATEALDLSMTANNEEIEKQEAPQLISYSTPKVQDSKLRLSKTSILDNITDSNEAQDEVDSLQKSTKKDLATQNKNKKKSTPTSSTRVENDQIENKGVKPSIIKSQKIKKTKLKKKITFNISSVDDQPPKSLSKKRKASEEVEISKKLKTETYLPETRIIENGRSTRSKKPVTYAEPNLKAKMRK